MIANEIHIVLIAEDYEKIFNLNKEEAEELFKRHLDLGLEDHMQEMMGSMFAPFIRQFHLLYARTPTSEQKEV